jgi:hypothetical protein
VSFGGYHGNVSVNNKLVAYAVIPTCATSGTLSGVNVTTSTLTHELIEAATDPFPNSNTPAYASVDDNHMIWSSALGGAEVGDMCAQFTESFYVPTELQPYFVQRTWSDVAAKAAHDPCVPAPANTPYFNSMPLLDSITTTGGGGTTQTQGVQIAVGSSKTIEVDLFSDGPTSGQWFVGAVEVKRTTTAPDTLSFSWDKPKGSNGDKLHVTITAVAASTSRRKSSTFDITSSLGSVVHHWYGMVVN